MKTLNKLEKDNIEATNAYEIVRSIWLRPHIRVKYQDFFKAEQIAFAYNGFEIVELLKVIDYLRNEDSKNPIFNVTTNPKFIELALAKTFKRVGIKMIALSFDPEKCKTIYSWIKAAKICNEAGLKVSANILMLDRVFKNIGSIVLGIEQYCEQIHLLRPKYYQTKISKKDRKGIIYVLKSAFPKKILIDQCFKWELFGKPCTRGKEFLALHPNGVVSLCSFDSEPYNKLRKVEDKKCPFI
jgi:hypothetical protein